MFGSPIQNRTLTFLFELFELKERACTTGKWKSQGKYGAMA